MSRVADDDHPVGAGDGTRLGRQRDGPHQPVAHAFRLALLEAADQDPQSLKRLFTERLKLGIDLVGDRVGLPEAARWSPERVGLALRSRLAVVHPLAGDL